MLKAIFMWIYCLDFHEVLFLLAAFTGIICAATAKSGHSRIWRSVMILVLAMWTAVVVTETIFRRTVDPSLRPIWQPFRSYADAMKEGGQAELLRSNFMNALLFYPAGVVLASLLPEGWRFRQKMILVLLLSAGFSTAIELVQGVCYLGVAQTDDVIHNTMGACLGAGAFLTIPKIIRSISSRRSEAA